MQHTNIQLYVVLVMVVHYICHIRVLLEYILLSHGVVSFRFNLMLYDVRVWCVYGVMLVDQMTTMMTLIIVIIIIKHFFLFVNVYRMKVV